MAFIDFPLGLMTAAHKGTGQALRIVPSAAAMVREPVKCLDLLTSPAAVFP